MTKVQELENAIYQIDSKLSELRYNINALILEENNLYASRFHLKIQLELIK